jgi:hypothetical protein
LVGRQRLPRQQRILCRRFPGTCETVGQVFIKCVWIMLKNKCCLYVIISIRFFPIMICNLLIDFPLYIKIILLMTKTLNTSCRKFSLYHCDLCNHVHKNFNDVWHPMILQTLRTCSSRDS